MTRSRHSVTNPVEASPVREFRVRALSGAVVRSRVLPGLPDELLHRADMDFRKIHPKAEKLSVSPDLFVSIRLLREEGLCVITRKAHRHGETACVNPCKALAGDLESC